MSLQAVLGAGAGLPDLALLLPDVRRELSAHGELGLLSISVLAREDEQNENWDDYASVLDQVSRFLATYAATRLRRSDMVLDPTVSGNTFVMLLGPPRNGRPLDRTDLTRVRHGLLRRSRRHLDQRLSPATLGRYGVYVGAALLRDEPGAQGDRLIYHGLERAFADALGERKKEELRHAIRLRRILEHGQVGTVFQPLLDLAAGRVLGFEALTRVPGEQFPTPDLLFRVAHENGALWPLERLCRTRALERAPQLDAGQRLFLNVEPDSIHDPALRETAFLEELARKGLGPENVVLELTEHAVVRDFGALRRTLRSLRETGYRLAMDDVGSGYAGLQTIAEIRPDYLKVDMTLVRDVHLDPIKRELIATILRFSERTGITMVAEGVERLEELRALSETGVRCAQGYLFARPAWPPRQPDWPQLGPWLRSTPGKS